MQYSVVSINQVLQDSESFRLDSEFFKKDFLETDRLIASKKFAFLGKITNKIDVGFVGSMVHAYTENGIPLLQTQNIQEFFVNNSNLTYIQDWFHQELKKSQIHFGDILIARSGSFGKTSIYLDDNAINSSDIIIVEANDKLINKFYLVTFLNSHHGVNQLFRFASGGLQGHVNLTILEQLKIPLLTTEFQEAIQTLILRARKQLLLSESLYTQAEEYLLDDLGLRNWQPQHALTFVSNYGKAEQFGRFDAEYFQPKYQMALSKLEKSQKKLGDFALLTKRAFSPQSNEPFNYIEISSVNKEGYCDSDIVLGSEAPSRAQWIVKSGDIITSTVRPIRSLSAMIEPNQDDYVCSSGFAVLKPKGIAPELLLVYLKLPVVCEILDLHTTASMYPAISTADLLNIPISLPDDKSIQQEVVDLVRKSREARQASRQILETAKHVVEVAVEKGEDVAKTWLKNKGNKLGMELN